MVTWTIFKKTSLGGKPNTKPCTGRPWHSERLQPLVHSIVSCVRTRMNRHSLKQHLVEGPVTYDFTLRTLEGP